MLRPIETDFNMGRHLVAFLQDSPFFAELSRHIHKVATDSIPTAGVMYDEKLDELVLGWNPAFFGGGELKGKVLDESGSVVEKTVKLEPLSNSEINGVLRHEYYHIVFGHLYGRRREPPKLWNIATDLAINSIILGAAREKGSGERALPEFCLVPGVRPKSPDGRDYTQEEKHAKKLADVIASLPPMKSSEWYFEKIKEQAESEKGKGDPTLSEAAGLEGGDVEVVIGGPDSLDSHEGWGTVPDELREYVEGKVKAVLEKAVKHADSQANGWGTIPADLVDAIRKSVSNVVDWRQVLRQFVGSMVRGSRATSIKRINKRYPYIHPGVKKGYQAKLLVAIDQSGSVSNEMLAEFFAELGSLTKKVTIDVLPFDCYADTKDIYTWRRGTDHPAKRVRGGGTDFNAPTKLANDPKNRGRWDGMLVMTDGEAPKPVPSRIRRGWVLGKGCKLYWGSTEEVLVKMDDGKAVTGAWR